MNDFSGTGNHYLYDELTTYCQSDCYPFHMPGHKRRLGALADPFTFDITEIEGFDNLHHAEGILLEAEQRAAAFYDSSETHFLVNGSTCGILSAVGVCVPKGRILMARNSHKAAYHAVYLNRLDVTYLYPEMRGSQWQEETACEEKIYKKNEYTGKEWGEQGCGGMISPKAVKEALLKYPDIRGVFITSPTYEGVVSDVAEIAGIVHEHGIPLIVDEAHGAHFGMHPIFPQSALKQGADVVIQSLHKTLPSLTQTALIHINGSLVDRRKLRKMLGIYQSSSPSYVLMAGMDQCIRILEEQGKRLFETFADNLNFFYRETKQLSVLKVIRTDDPSKILITVGGSGLSGRELSGILRETYHLEMEMEAVSYVLALTSVGDDREGFERLARALGEIDGKLAKEPQSLEVTTSHFRRDSRERNGRAFEDRYPAAEEISGKDTGSENQEITIWEAENALQEKVLLTESAGHISGEYIYLYPPGIPLVVPGERIEEKVLRQLLQDKEMGYSLQGMEDYSMEYLWVVKE